MLCSKCQEAIWSLLMYSTGKFAKRKSFSVAHGGTISWIAPLLDVITLDFYLFLLWARKDSFALRPDQYCTSRCEETPSAIKIWKLSGVPWASKAHILYSVGFDTLCPLPSNFFSLLPVSFFLPWSLWNGFYFFTSSQTASPLDHCCQVKVTQITNGLTVFARGSQIEIPQVPTDKGDNLILAMSLLLFAEQWSS